MDDIDPTSPSRAIVNTHDRPKLLDVAAALAIWAECKPDCLEKQHLLASTLPLPKGRTFRRLSRIGNTGACLIDQSGIIRVVEGSGWDHVALCLCSKHPQLIKGGHLVVSRQLCTTCTRRLIQCGVHKITVVQHDCPPWPKELNARTVSNFFTSFFRASKEPPQDYLAFEKSLAQFYNSPGQSTYLSALALVPDSIDVLEWRSNAPKKEAPTIKSFLQKNPYVSEHLNLFTRSNVSLSIVHPTQSLPFQILQQLQEKTGQKPDIDTWGLGCALLLSCRSQFVVSSKSDKPTQAHVGAVAVHVTTSESLFRGYSERPCEILNTKDCVKAINAFVEIIKPWTEKQSKQGETVTGSTIKDDIIFITSFFCGDSRLKYFKGQQEVNSSEFPEDNRDYLCIVEGTKDSLTASFYKRLQPTSIETYEVISLGYNGSLSKISDEDTVIQGGLATVHAEENTVVFTTASLKGATLYVTHAPCKGCGRMIIDTMIKKIRYLTVLESPHIFDNVHGLDQEIYKSSFLTNLLTTIRNYFESHTVSPDDVLVSKRAIEQLITGLQKESEFVDSLTSYLLLQERKVKIVHPTATILQNKPTINKLVRALSHNQMLVHPFKKKNVKQYQEWKKAKLLMVEVSKTEEPMLAKPLTSFAPAILEPFVLMSLLHHQNLANYSGICKIGEQFVFIMPKMDFNLHTWLQTNPGLEDQLRVLSGVARGLQHLHSCGFQHGNLKPSNILIWQNTAKLADYSSTEISSDFEALQTLISQFGTRQHLTSSEIEQICTSNDFGEIADKLDMFGILQFKE